MIIQLMLAVVLPLTGDANAADVSAFDRNLAVEYVSVTNGVKWIDGRALPIEGRAFDDVEHDYDRLPSNVTAKVNGGVRFMKHHTAGLQFRFTTDAARLRLRWTPYDPNAVQLPHMPATAVSGLDVYRYDAAQGRWLHHATGQVKDGKAGGSIEFGWTPGEACLVNLPLYNGIRSFELGIAPTNTVTAPPPRKSGVTKPVVFYGTSITQGAAASRPGMSFVNIVGRRLDVPVVNLGFSGCGRMELEMSEHLARIDASCYVLDCLWNMSVPWRKDGKVEENYEPFVRNLRRLRPGVPIVMAERCDVHQNEKDTRNDFIRALYDRLVAEGWKNLYYLPKDGMYANDGEGTVEGVHPNDRGMMSLAEAFGAAVGRALSGQSVGGLVVDPAKESMDFAVPKGVKGFAWSKLQWDARCAVAVERAGNLPADVVARASKYPNGRILVYACRTNDAPGKVDFTISLVAGSGTLRGAKAFAVDAADKQTETVAHYDNYGRMIVSLGPREGLLIDADPLAQMPFVDLSGETDRQFVIAEGTPTFYNGHPTMTACESPDHLIAVWTSEHAGHCGPAAESLDGGKTWTRIDERFPAEWKKAINCPSIYYLKGPDGKSRLWAWANALGKRELASMMPSVMSEDNGKTWKLMPPLGERFRCVMAFTSVVQFPDGRCFAAFHRSQKALKSGWQDVAPHEVAGTFSSDGGFTWSDPFVVASDPAGEEWYCEPGAFLSPDGTELCCLLREQHRGLSRMCFSKDFGKTWSKPVPTSRGVSGHRHVAHVLPDGRVAVALRSWYQPLENPRRDPHFGCWIGPYSSIRAGTDADAMMVKLLEPKPGKNWGTWDTGYPAFAINAAGEIVAATYIHYRADENRHSIAGIRFDPRQMFKKP